MRIFNDFIPKAAKILKNGGVGVVPTDTLYGVSASVFSKAAIRRIYRLRKRDPKKPLIVLISSLRDTEKLGIQLQPEVRKLLAKLWPGRVSVVLPCADKSLVYLHRGTNSLAVRLPHYRKLVAFLKKTGPLVSASVNPQGRPPAETIAQAVKYFGDKIDFYVDIGHLSSAPSTLISLLDSKPKILRPGAVKLNFSK